MQTYSSIASREQVKKQNWEGFGKYAAVVYFEILCWNWRVWGEPRTLSDRICSLWAANWAPDFSKTKQSATHSTDVKFCVDISLRFGVTQSPAPRRCLTCSCFVSRRVASACAMTGRNWTPNGRTEWIAELAVVRCATAATYSELTTGESKQTDLKAWLLTLHFTVPNN
jgi:hypothetical protein